MLAAAGLVSAQDVVAKIVGDLGGADGAEEDFAETTIATQPVRPRVSDSGVTVQGASDVYVKLARCCTPVPPDEIMGFVTRGAGISVHRKDCANMLALTSTERVVEVEWAPTQSSVFLVEIQVEALDRRSLLSDVTRVLSENHVNILSASVHTSKSRLAISRFAFEMPGRHGAPAAAPPAGRASARSSRARPAPAGAGSAGAGRA